MRTLQKMDETLHKKLTDLRAEIATRNNVLPFFVFHTESIKQMAIQKPATIAALLEIKFVTTGSASKYGKAFLRIIKQDQFPVNH